MQNRLCITTNVNHSLISSEILIANSYTKLKK
nr:MAG TPA: hypothetical protein [Bacteriophage sp.]